MIAVMADLPLQHNQHLLVQQHPHRLVEMQTEQER